VNCGSILNESNSKWNETIANGEIIYGECLKGFNGTVSRSCLQNDTIGNWSSISGSCQGFPFLFLSFFQFAFNFLLRWILKIYHFFFFHIILNNRYQ